MSLVRSLDVEVPSSLNLCWWSCGALMIDKICTRHNLYEERTMKTEEWGVKFQEPDPYGDRSLRSKEVSKMSRGTH